MSLNEMIVAIVFLPLLSAMLTGLFVRSIDERVAQYLTTGVMIFCAILSTITFSRVIFGGVDATVPLATWIASGDFALNWALKVDPLTAVMLVVVTWVSAVVHTYSIGYMSHDPHKTRFMAYLSLFTFCMLMLVTADNFVQLFFGWEGVGLSSYLLIGFWFKKESANAASMKAFIVNRVGDFGFALGIMTLFVLTGSVEFDSVFAAAPALANAEFTFLGGTFPALDVACILLFIGAMGKSAQLLLHTWLPDAMEGPTPVSALIHAATMVTAGVFMVARCSPVFEYAPHALMLVTIVGASTAFFAATIGMVQNDIKRVIAYSTCSQLGYMFFACGVGAYPAAIFHLMTHAFFKALLFLGAGSVIHAMSDEQDMRNMGGLWKKIPFTYAFMWIGSLALAGIPLFAGYYSKDMILEAAYASGSDHGLYAFYLGIGAALMTAFYSWRLIFMTFHGKSRASKQVQSHIHESAPIMLVPLIPLVLGALFAGYLGYKSFGMVDADGAFWRDSIVMLERDASDHDKATHEEDNAHQSLVAVAVGTAAEAINDTVEGVEDIAETAAAGISEVVQESLSNDAETVADNTDNTSHDKAHSNKHGAYDEPQNILYAAHHVPAWVIALPLLVAVSGIILAYLAYMTKSNIPKRMTSAFPRTTRFLQNKWYFDELYNALFVKRSFSLGKGLWKRFDVGLIDRFGPNGFAAFTQKIAAEAKSVQTGYIYHYAFVMLIGLVLLISMVYFYMWSA